MCRLEDRPFMRERGMCSSEPGEGHEQRAREVEWLKSLRDAASEERRPPNARVSSVEEHFGEC